MSTLQTMTLVRRQVVQFGVLLSHVFLKLVKARVAFPLPEAPRTAADLAMMESKFEMYGSFVTLKVSLSAEARPAGITEVPHQNTPRTKTRLKHVQHHHQDTR
jgi:hypothetical protein